MEGVGLFHYFFVYRGVMEILFYEPVINDLKYNVL